MMVYSYAERNYKREETWEDLYELMLSGINTRTQ